MNAKHLYQQHRIPKRIHYCWFGGKDKPDIVKRCIQSWKTNLPEYEIIEWNETSFDINSHVYTKGAYEARKFAFVSDYVRVYALYHFGGIYLDTDVEVFKPFDNFLHHESFWGFEQANYVATSTIGAAEGNKLIRLFLDSYEHQRFVLEDGGTYEGLTNVGVITQILESKGLQPNGQYQYLEELGAFYPQTYFSPYDYINCRKLITANTYAMHYFHKSWLPPKARIKGHLKLLASKVIGGDNIAKIRKLVSRM